MSKMINIKGQNISEDTIVEALKKHCGFQKDYRFQAGDVALNHHDDIRIICAPIDKLISIDKWGFWQNDNENFNAAGYRKVTTLNKIFETLAAKSLCNIDTLP